MSLYLSKTDFCEPIAISKTFGLGPQFVSIVKNSTPPACQQKLDEMITKFRDQIHHQFGQQIL